MPVLPDEESRMVLPRVRKPASSASEIIRKAARSLTDPPGFPRSSLAKTLTFGGRAAVILLIRTSGVAPIRSSADDAADGFSRVPSIGGEHYSRYTGRMHQGGDGHDDDR